MATCNQCRFHKIDKYGHACANRGLVYTDYVEGRRECYVLNRDGNCEHFKEFHRVQVMGMLISGGILLVIVGSFVAYEMSKKNRTQRMQAKIASQFTGQLKKEKIKAEKLITVARRAKQPVKVWKGTVGEFDVYIEEFEPMRK